MSYRDYSKYPPRMVIMGDQDAHFVHCHGCHRSFTTDAKIVEVDKYGNKTIYYRAMTDFVRSDGYKRWFCVDTAPCLQKQQMLKAEKEKKEKDRKDYEEMAKKLQQQNMIAI